MRRQEINKWKNKILHYINLLKLKYITFISMEKKYVNYIKRDKDYKVMLENVLHSEGWWKDSLVIWCLNKEKEVSHRDMWWKNGSVMRICKYIGPEVGAGFASKDEQTSTGEQWATGRIVDDFLGRGASDDCTFF